MWLMAPTFCIYSHAVSFPISQCSSFTWFIDSNSWYRPDRLFGICKIMCRSRSWSRKDSMAIEIQQPLPGQNVMSRSDMYIFRTPPSRPPDLPIYSKRSSSCGATPARATIFMSDELFVVSLPHHEMGRHITCHRNFFSDVEHTDTTASSSEVKNISHYDNDRRLITTEKYKEHPHTDQTWLHRLQYHENRTAYSRKALSLKADANKCSRIFLSHTPPSRYIFQDIMTLHGLPARKNEDLMLSMP